MVYYGIYYPIASSGVIAVFLVGVLLGALIWPFFVLSNSPKQDYEKMPRFSWLRNMFKGVHEYRHFPLIFFAAFMESI
ncbi:MAG: hypothetical protein H9W81_03295 [Enterococcus sp.]|nr:hypothetical protein [Enterococcus sp.]